MRDGVTLRGDLYRPEGDPTPTLIMRTPYSKDMPVGLMVVLNPVVAAAAGYSVLIQDVRGRFGSEGDFVPFENEAQDGFDTVEWAATQEWSTGAVGMFGSSYMAATQLQAAGAAPPHLRALCPIEGSADYFEGRSYKGGTFELGALLSITLLTHAMGAVDRSGLSSSEVRAARRELKAMLDDLPRVAATAPLSELRKTVLGTYAPAFFDWMENDQAGPYWERTSVASKHDAITVPALHISSWYDTYVVGAIANYLGIKARGATDLARENQHLWLGPWGHYMPRSAMSGVARLGEVEFGLGAALNLDAVQLAWFDRWLKNDDSAWRYDAPVRYFTMGDNAWRQERQWPPTAADQRLHLGPGGRLLTHPPARSEPDSYRSDPDNPVPTIGGAHLVLDSAYPQGPLNQRRAERRSDVLLYTTEPLTSEVEIAGEVTLEIWIASTAPSTDVAATLSIVGEDGESVGLMDGIRRVSLRAGAPTRVEVVLGPVAQAFKPGQRVRLRVAGSNFPRHDLNPQTGERASVAAVRVAANQEVFHEPEHPSVLRLPVTRGTFR